jgi:hypothetical protein
VFATSPNRQRGRFFMYTRARGTSPKRKHKPRGNEQTAGWATTDVQEVGSQPDFRLTFAPIATRLLREMSRKQRLKDRVEHTLAVVKAFSIAVPGRSSLSSRSRPPPAWPTRAPHAAPPFL